MAFKQILNTRARRAQAGRGRSAAARARQLGFLMLEVSLALLVALAAAAAGFISAQRATDATNAMAQADNLQFYRDAAETLIQENYIRYQAGLPITRNGVTLAFGSSPGEALQPTTANLKAMALGVDNAAEQGFYKSLTAASYQINIERFPVGCNVAPNPVNGVLCNIKGTVCFTRPVQPFGAAAGETDGFAIGKMLGRLGGNGGASVEGVEVTINGNGGGWAEPNPIAGTPAGVVCSRFGFGSSGLANFLRLNDNRDPGFQGGMTLDGTNATGNALQVNGATAVAGNLNVGGSAAFAGAAAFAADVTVVDGAGTACVRIQNSGQIDINCNGILNARLGTFTGPGGVVSIGNTGTAYTVDTNGAVRGQTGFFTAVGSVFGDNTLGIRAAGTGFTIQTGAGVDALSVQDFGRTGSRTSLASPALGLSDPVTAGTVCASPAADVPATITTNAATTVIRALVGGGLASCIGGLWTPITQSAVPGSACSPDGIQAISTVDGRTLTCRNSVYMQINDLLSSFVLMNTYRVTDGSIVTKPACGQLGAGFGQPVPVLTAQVESSTNSSFNRRVDDASATTWRVVLQDSTGASLAGTPFADALFFSYCYY